MKTAKVEICTDKPTVNKIIEAALPLFATKGMASVSVKELADAAGVNIALISYYFGGKENLYAYVLEKQLSTLGDAIDIISKEDISAIMKIRQFADILVVIHKKNPYIDRLFYIEIFNPTKYFNTLVKTAAKRMHFFLSNCILDAVASGEFRADIDPQLAAMSLLRILNLSFTSQHLCKEILPARDDLAQQYMAQAVEIYLTGVTNNFK
ncbi:TetR/AcrR family transcriptional regulator [Sporomusa termitida]|uniref:TetR/AcrR family transcriptional regulator n=1 Tax=Sporomusa termitida TaxID=2377 RepID=UPI001FEA2ADD|nr:TetR family transcriptional regulator [Sporomusa termitida]